MKYHDFCMEPWRILNYPVVKIAYGASTSEASSGVGNRNEGDNSKSDTGEITKM